MPLSKYFKGDGEQVMADMVKRYGPVKGKQMFYATANKQGQAPPTKKKHKHRRKHSKINAALRGKG